MLVDVAVFAPPDKPFTYRWPSSLGEPVSGIRVCVPFGKASRVGVVLDVREAENEAADLKYVADRLDLAPLYDPARTRWLERLRRYYLAGSGEAWATALGWAAHDDALRLSCPDIPKLEAAWPQLSGIFRSQAPLSIRTMQRRAADRHCRYAIACARRDGLLSPPESEHRAGADRPAPRLALNEEQQRALAAIREAGSGFHAFLLFGRTGSGKTEVFLRAAADVVAKGRQVLVLVPEIGLTPMWLQRLRQRFGEVHLWHSAMAAGERQAVLTGMDSLEVLIGTRSALFLPLPRLAMIIVDEEHDVSFKQQDGVHYSARDMAVLLAQQLDIPIVLGSATPSLESWRLVREGRYQRLDLPRPVIGDERPAQTRVVDMRGQDGPLSELLIRELEQTFAAGEQAMLYLNRRGYAPALQCTACGEVPSCPHCSLRLSLHRRAGRLRCHACGHGRRVPMVCEACGESAFMPLGEGTEKIEDALAGAFPSACFARFDRDILTSQRRLEETLAAFDRGEIDALIGTQMLVKGHDFHRVTLVGIINADLGISLPDFRAGERWWQQMLQVYGRAGRGDRPGRIIIQTRMPDAAWLTRVAAERAEQVLDEELQMRRGLNFPPFGRWVRVVFSARQAKTAAQAAEAFASICRDPRSGLDAVQISGPMACALERLAGRYRFEVLLRDASRKLLPWRLAPLLALQELPSSVRRRVDVDPQDMM